MTFNEIRAMPTTIDTGRNGARIHESVLRSYHVVQKVRELLEQNCPPVALIQIIDDLQNAPGGDKVITP